MRELALFWLVSVFIGPRFGPFCGLVVENVAHTLLGMWRTTWLAGVMDEFVLFKSNLG